MANAPLDAQVLECEELQGIPQCIPRCKTHQAEQNAVIHEADRVNRAAPVLHQLKHLVQQGARAF